MATVNELLSRPNSAKQISAETRNLIQILREEMKQAQAEDKARAKNYASAGKTGLKALKTRKDFLLAKRGNPELSFKDFLLNDKESSKYMRKGVENIINKKNQSITMKEIFGFDKDRALTDNALKNKIAPYKNKVSEEMFIPQDVAVPEFDANKMIEQSTSSYYKPENLEMITKQNPEMLEEVIVKPNSSSQVNSAVDSASSTSSVLGTAGSALSVGSALKDLGTKGLTPKTGLNAIGTGMQLSGVLAVPGTILKGIAGLLGSRNA